MGHAPDTNIQIVEQFKAPASARSIIVSLLISGLVIFGLGLFFQPKAPEAAGHGTEHATVSTALASNEPGAASEHPATAEEGHAATAEGEHAEAGHHAPTQWTRIWANLLICSYMFTGIGLMSLFFLAVSYVTEAGWMGVVRRVAEAASYMLPVGAVLLLLVLFFGGSSIYSHWMGGQLETDPILQRKTWWLGVTPFYIRAVVYLVIWVGFWWLFKRASLKEDKEGDSRDKLVKISAPFIMLFALSWSAASWDWVMSIEPHWFSTMFGVYTFASVFVSALALITILCIFLKANGLLPVFNNSHLHDLGKFVFAFSIFWTYIWFCQFMLIWYANIPEETKYFTDRVGENGAWNGPYVWYFFGVLIINFILPFIGLMSAGSKRVPEYLAAVCFVIVLGHWIDIQLMVLPGTMGVYGTFGLLELGMFVFFLGLFFAVAQYGLGQAPLIAKNDRFLKESLVHNYH